MKTAKKTKKGERRIAASLDSALSLGMNVVSSVDPIQNGNLYWSSTGIASINLSIFDPRFCISVQGSQ